MNNIDAFNSLVFTFLTIFSIVYISVNCFNPNFFKHDTRYIPLNRVLKLGILNSLYLIIGNLNLKIKKNIKVDTITPNDHLITFMLGLKERESWMYAIR